MNIKERLSEDLKNAMKKQEFAKCVALRNLKTEFTNLEKQEDKNGKKLVLTEKDYITVLQSVIKKRNKSAKTYQDAKRDDLAQVELQEVKFIEIYLPEQLSEDELKTQIEEIVKINNFSTMKDMGKAMKSCREKFGTSAEPAKISKIVKGFLK